MKKYNDIVSIDGYEEDVFVCELSMLDVCEAEKELFLYMQKRGETYERDTNKEPYIKSFFELYFGEEDYDIYCGAFYTVPNRYVCHNKDIADRFMKMAKRLACHDRYNQTYCDVIQDGIIIDIVYGDY